MSGSRAVGVFTHPSYQRHDMGPMHPERPDRLRALDSLWKDLDPARFRIDSDPPPVDLSLLEDIHSPAYIERVREACERGPAVLDPDTSVVPDSWEAALKAAGAVVEACRRVKDGELRRAFCAVRPPGHHAERGRAMGFCLFNNIAVGAEALRDWGIGKVAIVDFDGHHGNGTQDSFWEEPDVLFTSCHQFPFYPGTGAREERGAGMGLDATLNYPLPAGAGDETVIPWFEGELAAALRRFKPRFILVSAGFDAHRDDPLVMLNVSTEGFARISALLVELAEELCEGRLVSTLEGGYDLGALRDSVAAHLEALAAGA